MSVSLNTNVGSVVAKAGQQINVGTLLNITASSSNPTYVVVSLLDRNEYTASSTGATGTLSGNGNSTAVSSIGGDSEGAGIVFTYNAATGQYVNATYGNLSSLVYTASTNTNDNTSISIFTTNNASIANSYANNSVDLQYLSTAGYGSVTSYLGSVSVVTQPSVAGTTPSQATPDSIEAAAMSFVGKTWNDEGCWVLASNISAEAGASLPITSTELDVPGVASGEWIVAYNGPAGQTGNWQANITAGEMVVFATTSGGGHITTVASGSGSTAMVVDNAVMGNAANDGSSSDIIIAGPHAASAEWAQAVAGSVVVYELDCPTITITTGSSTVAASKTEALAPMFAATNPLASQSITEYQFYDTGSTGSVGSFMVGSNDTVATSAATAVTVSASALSSVDLLAGSTSGTDTVEVRAYNGSYWGDWASMTVGVTGSATTTTTPAVTPAVTTPTVTAPTVATQTATQTWRQGQAVDFSLAPNTFTATSSNGPSSVNLTYTATLSNGAALPSWLHFNAATETFTGTVPTGTAGFSIKVTAADGSGSTSETFSVLTPAAAPPTVTAQTANQYFKFGQSVDLALPANTFTDPQGESLTYKATLFNGSALPSWLQFNGATDTFTGTIPASSPNMAILVTATDTSGLSTTEKFNIYLSAPSAPTLTAQTAAQTWTEGQAINFSLAANTFTDPLAETMTYKATLSGGAALPTWLQFNAATDTFTGTAPTTASTLKVAVTATNAGGASTTDTFAVSIVAAANSLTQAIAGTTSGSAPGSIGVTGSTNNSGTTLASPLH